MPHVFAQRELLARREEVWSFLAEPHHLPDWWPGIGGVEPDRRGLAPGARWRVFGSGRPTLLRRPEMSGTLVVLRVEPPTVVEWQFTGERLDVELRLDDVAGGRTLATLGIRGPWLVGLRRSLPRKALLRLHSLIQTVGEL
jgi:uncharacterized protein YndB with AHSA1/START domain